MNGPSSFAALACTVSAARNRAGNSVAICKHTISHLVPEMTMVFVVLAVAMMLRVMNNGQAPHPSQQEAWDDIKAGWPVLMTADTLLGLQAMFRVVVLLCVVQRSGASGKSPVADEAAVMWLFAGIARAAVFMRCLPYRLDGPLGGTVAFACEVALLPMLLAMGRNTFRRAPLSVAALMGIAGMFATRHNLALAAESTDDCLFALAHTFDFLTACAYLLRTLLADHGPNGAGASTGFVHVLMAVQQFLSAYYWAVAFDPVAELVGNGKPFEAIQLCNFAQLGVYVMTAALHIVESLEGPGQDGRDSFSNADPIDDCSGMPTEEPVVSPSAGQPTPVANF